jgi:hypothetical protein
MKLEIRFGAVVRTMTARCFADVLVETADTFLLHRESEDQVDRLLRVVAVATRVPRLVHVREPHPRSPSGI